LLTPNEWRALEDLEPYDGGDDYYGPLNTPAIESKAAAEATEGVAPATAEATPTLPDGEPVNPNLAAPVKELPNGAQAQAVLAVIQSAATGAIPRQSAVNLVGVLLGLTAADADALVGPAGTNAATTPNPNPSLVQEEPTPQPTAESKDEAFSAKLAPLFAHVAERVRTKQTKAFSNNKRQGDEFETWLGDFASKQGLMLGEELNPILSTFVSDVTSLSFSLQGAVEDYEDDVRQNKEAADPLSVINKVIAKIEGK
jgi:hypothetical protein